MTSVYEIVTDRIIKQLETVKVSDYDTPWFKLGAVPRNAITKKEYRGINWLLLSGIGSGHFATYKQWEGVKCQVKKGERASLVTFWSPILKKEGNTEEIKSFVLRYYNVFEASQVEGDYARALEVKKDKLNPLETIAHADQFLIKDYIHKQGITLINGGDSAFYRSSSDLINMPLLGQFKSAEQYYATLAHEIIHSTGHVTRLDRKLGNSFGSEDYAKEELIAELGAAMLCCELGLDLLPRPDHAAYIKSWLTALRNDSKYVIQAASKAQRACDFIKGKKFDQEETPQQETNKELEIAA